MRLHMPQKTYLNWDLYVLSLLNNIIIKYYIPNCCCNEIFNPPKTKKNADKFTKFHMYQ